MKKIAVLIVTLMTAACMSGGKSTPSSFYMLRKPDVKQYSSAHTKKVTIGVERVVVPTYLDRPQMVIRADEGYQVTLSEFHRWAEPLADAIPRLVTENISANYEDIRIRSIRSRRTEFNYLVMIEVHQLDAAFDKTADIDAWWSLMDNKGRAIKEGRFKSKLPVDDTYESIVEKESQLIISLSDAIAREIQKQEKAK